MAATHSDSPTYKLKVNPILHKDKHYISLNVSGYGGMIHPTFWTGRSQLQAEFL